MGGYTIECVLDCKNHLGEGPVWDGERGMLYWLDCTGNRVGNPTVWRLDPRTGQSRPVPERGDPCSPLSTRS